MWEDAGREACKEMADYPRKEFYGKQMKMEVKTKRETGLGHESFRCHTQEIQLILGYGTIESFKQGWISVKKTR